MIQSNHSYSVESGTPVVRVPGRLQLWAGAMVIQTGMVHVIAGSDHFKEWWGYGVFFLIVSLCQFAGGGALLISRSRRLYWIGLLGTALVLLVWAISRTTGIHIGPDGAGPEPIGVLDAICSLLEVAVLCCMVRLLLSRQTSSSRVE